MVITGVFAALALATANPQPMPVAYCQPEPSAAPKAMGVVSAYGIVLGERYRNDEMTQGELMAAIQRIQNIVRLMASNQPDEACALILPLETDYGLERPDMTTLPS